MARGSGMWRSGVLAGVWPARGPVDRSQSARSASSTGGAQRGQPLASSPAVVCAVGSHKGHLDRCRPPDLGPIRRPAASCARPSESPPAARPPAPSTRPPSYPAESTLAHCPPHASCSAYTYTYTYAYTLDGSLSAAEPPGIPAAEHRRTSLYMAIRGAAGSRAPVGSGRPRDAPWWLILPRVAVRVSLPSHSSTGSPGYQQTMARLRLRP